MAKKDLYTTPASQQGLTARQLVEDRIKNLIRMAHDGRKIMNTNMTSAFAASV